MIPVRLDSLTTADVQTLVDNAVRERRTLDYKEGLPGPKDKDAKEFLFDVTSFANAGGGDIIYGVRELRDEAGQPSGIPEAIVGLGNSNLDAETCRLENLVRDGVDPRIPGFRIKAVENDGSARLLVIRVPRSWLAPHMVTLKGTSKFYSRNSAGKHPLDVTEIRAAFLASEGQADRVQRFRDERIGRIVAGEVPGPLMYDAFMVLHVFPAAALDPSFRFDIQSNLEHCRVLKPMGGSGWDHRYNFDGFMTWAGPSSEQIIRAYTQVFRNGAIEALNSSLLTDERRIKAISYEKMFIDALSDTIKFYQAVELSPPYFVMPALIGVRGSTLAVSRELSMDDLHAIDRDILLLPDATIEAADEAPSQVLRPAFDAVWQAGGFPRSTNFDADGKWREHR